MKGSRWTVHAAEIGADEGWAGPDYTFVFRKAAKKGKLRFGSVPTLTLPD